MKKFYKITDSKVAVDIAAILAKRIEFCQKWIDYAASLGFADARITKGSSCFVELEFKGFVASQEQFHSVDKDKYKFLTNIRGNDLKEYSVWGVRKSNKKAYREFLEGAPFDPKEILTLVELQGKLVKDFSPLHGVCAAHSANEVVIFATADFMPFGDGEVKVKDGLALEILESEFLALQGL